MTSVAVLSLHTSPLVLPGSGDSGGMNVYVRELVSSLSQAGVRSTVYVRRWDDDLPEVVEVEPGFKVVHVTAGPVDLPKGSLESVIDEFAEGVERHFLCTEPVDLIHANYWLSGLAGHRLKHEFELPLVSTFHTLARVKAVTGDPEPQHRIDAETEVIGCSDAILASCQAEEDDLVGHYGAPPERIEIVAPGVDRAFFSPGDRIGARSALGLREAGELLLFVGRIQPLKQLTVAVETLAALGERDTRLLVVGGPSGPDGLGELAEAWSLAHALGVADRLEVLPPQPHHLLSTYYRAADAVLVPSRSESFGLVALEAAACGTPVVAAGVGGLTTIVDHGRTGYLVEGRSATDYARALSALLDTPELAEQMGRTAARQARRYTWSTTAGRLRRLYADLAPRSLVNCA